LSHPRRTRGHVSPTTAQALCPRCNLLYVRGSADDEERHAALCAKAARGIDFAGWK
ncbi:unnamed protein product, partial [Ectocarpus sp. 12 AP-2014]